jgi:hypothetical protein
MTAMRINPALAAPETAIEHEPKIPTPLSVIAWLSMAATVLSLMIAAALSLIVWSTAG